MADNGVTGRAEAVNGGAQKRNRDAEDDETATARDGQMDIEGALTFENTPHFQNDDDDVGPMPVEDVPKKKRRVLPHEKAYLDRLPSSARYTKSFMHRDTLSHVTVTPSTDFIITTSIDGVVKFWKKQAVGIEFVKQYRGHLGPVSAVSVSADGGMYVSASTDKTIKIFDVVNFDMFNMMTVPYTPKAVCFVYKRSAMIPLLAISDADSPKIYIYNARGGGTPLHTLEKIHSRPVHIMSYNPIYDCVVSADTGGMIEYWQPSGDFQKPSDVFEFKSKTDLYDFKKAKSVPACLTFSKDGEKFVSQSFPDRQVRIFGFRTGKCLRKYDESITTITELQQSESTFKLDTITFGARLSADRELEKTTSSITSANVIFDESGNFIIYATLIGIKVVNTVTNRMVRLLGKDESHRFTNLALYQGAPKKKEFNDLAMAASDNPLLAEAEMEDPILFCTAFRKARFFMFTAGMEDTKGDRDVYNEKPTRDDRVEVEKKVTQSGNSAVIHTTMGDIFVKLFPNAAPKAVENFATLAMSGYYDGTIFHRIIPKFMIQGGDPLGDGTGGESIWGKKFDDEISDLKHTKYTLSMANAGPNTNGSQFFITTEATPWLDGKHTIFGRATKGLDVLHQIENLPRKKNDRPEDPPSIVNIDIS